MPPEADSLLTAAEVRKYSKLNPSILLEAIFQVGVGLNYTDTYFNHYLYAIKHPPNFFYFNLGLLRDDFSYQGRSFDIEGHSVSDRRMARESLRDMHIVSHSRSLILHLKAPLQKLKVNIDDYCQQVCC